MLSLIGVHDSDFVIKLSKSQIRTRMYVVKSEKNVGPSYIHEVEANLEESFLSISGD